MRRNTVLPDKPSELLMVSMIDLEKIEKDKNVQIDMTTWVDQCEVCHAGAVMVNSLGVDANKYVSPFELNSPELQRKLHAINSIREGNISDFFENLCVENPWVDWGFLKLQHCGYDEHGLSPNYYSNRKHNSVEDWNTYKNWIVSFIGILQAEGL